MRQNALFGWLAGELDENQRLKELVIAVVSIGAVIVTFDAILIWPAVVMIRNMNILLSPIMNNILIGNIFVSCVYLIVTVTIFLFKRGGYSFQRAFFSNLLIGIVANTIILIIQNSFLIPIGQYNFVISALWYLCAPIFGFLLTIAPAFLASGLGAFAYLIFSMFYN